MVPAAPAPPSAAPFSSLPSSFSWRRASPAPASAAARVPADVRAAAREMADEEREHVRLIGEWLAKVSPPEPGWDEDMDPPAVAD